MPQLSVILSDQEWTSIEHLIEQTRALSDAAKDGSVKGALTIDGKESPGYKLAGLLKAVVEASDGLGDMTLPL